MIKIDLESWDRREHYLFFRRSDYPHYHIGTNLEITAFKARAKEEGLPFSFALTHAVTAAINKVEAFRYRIQGSDVALHKLLHPYFSYIAPDKKYFKMVLAEMGPDIHTFAKTAQKKALAQEEYFIPGDAQARSDLVIISSIPNVSFTHLSHTITLTHKDDAIPRLSWGRFFEREGRWMLPFNIQAHHAFVDGDHMGQYINTLQEDLNSGAPFEGRPL